MRSVFLALALVAACSCASGRFSSRCNEQVNHCVQNCPRELPGMDRQRQVAPNTSPTALCQQQCYDVGRSCQEREDKVAREEAAKRPATPIP